MDIFKKITCNRIKKKLSLYYDNQLSAKEMEYFKEHVNRCENCANALKLVEKISLATKNREIKSIPPIYLQEIHHNLGRANFEIHQPKIKKIGKYILSPKFRFALVSFVFAIIVVMPFINYYRYNMDKKMSIDTIASNIINVNQNGVIRFRIDAKENIDNITIKIELSNGIRYVKNGQIDDKEELILHGSLDKGENIVAVYVKGVQHGNWQAKAIFQERFSIKKIKIPFTVL